MKTLLGRILSWASDVVMVLTIAVGVSTLLGGVWPHVREVAVEAQVGRTWSITHAPAANTKATISQAAVAGMVHVAECASAVITAGTTAPTAAVTTLQLRDGATGAGTIEASWAVAVPATAGLMSPPIMLCGLGIAGSPNTAMTLEFAAAAGANTFESVSLSGRTQ